MLLPRYSLRTTLLLVSAFAVFSLVLAQAAQSEPWAVVVVVAVVSLGVIMLFHALVYLLCYGVTRLITAQQALARTSQGGLQAAPDQQSAIPTSGEETSA